MKRLPSRKMIHFFHTPYSGAATPTAVIFTLVSMLITVAYLKYSLSAAVAQRYRRAEAMALLVAEAGLNIEAPVVLPKLTGDTLLAAQGVEFGQLPDGKPIGTYHDVACTTRQDFSGRTIYHAQSTGTTSYRNSLGEPVTVSRVVELNMVSQDFSKFMYFTNSEEPGGGPWLGSYVSFGSNDVLDGIIHTNGHITISQYGCPDFSQAEVNAADGITLNNCNPNSWASLDDSAQVITYPPYNAANRAKAHATYVFTADDLLGRGVQKDTLIMTEIEFITGGFEVRQWTYLIPPIGAEGPPPIDFLWDEDTDFNGLNNRRIAFDSPYSGAGFYVADSLFISSQDIDGVDVTQYLDEYVVGDTIVVKANDSDSLKYWKGVITSTNVQSGDYIFGVVPLSQSFINGFVDGEEVSLNYVAELDPTKPFNKFAYYHNHPNDGSSVCQSSGFHHFDFEPPVDGPDIMPTTTFYTHQAVIYVRGGQVRVKGEVDGQFTIVTDIYTEYRRHDDPSIIDRVYDNIWLVDDIIYDDSDPSTGEVVYGTDNRLGLISGANIIIANTIANGARNQSAGGQDIIINGALLAMQDSFVAHYWQNTVSRADLNGPNWAAPALSKGDGRGPRRNPDSSFPSTTGTSDIRGVVKLWGSVTQNKRGYMKRNFPGPYDITPGIGYDKDYHYDYNFSDFYPPPHFPSTTTEDGAAILVMKSYGEIPPAERGPNQ
ncbi:MAG: hypothetical protein ACE5DP_01285 [Fidelibacterota bacterium]